MSYLLDTNVVIALLKNNPPSPRHRFRHLVNGGAAINTSSIVLFELWYGVMRSQRRVENAQRLRAFLCGAINILPFDEEDAAYAGQLRADLAREGMPIGPYDLLIAAQALRIGATLVTANVSEFSRIHGLSWQDWTDSD